MNLNSSIFYGINFKKIRLYAKFKGSAASKYLRYYDNEYNLRPDILGYGRFFDVRSVDFYDEIAKINVFDKRTNMQCLINVKFEDIEFAYYFEKTKEEELNALEF